MTLRILIPDIAARPELRHRARRRDDLAAQRALARLRELKPLSPAQLVEQRYQKFRVFSAYTVPGDAVAAKDV